MDRFVAGDVCKHHHASANLIEAVILNSTIAAQSLWNQWTWWIYIDHVNFDTSISHFKFQMKNHILPHFLYIFHIHFMNPSIVATRTLLPSYRPPAQGRSIQVSACSQVPVSQTDQNARPFAWPWGPWSRPRWWNDHKKHSLRRRKNDVWKAKWWGQQKRLLPWDLNSNAFWSQGLMA